MATDEGYGVVEIAHPSGDPARSLLVRLSEHLPICFRERYVCDHWIDRTTVPVLEELDDFFAESFVVVTAWRDGSPVGGGPSYGEAWRSWSISWDRVEIRSWLGTHDRDEEAPSEHRLRSAR